jgi:purine nucleoside phosphorylase
MPVGILTGSGTYALPGFEGEGPDVDTRFGPVAVNHGTLAGVEVLHISRHGEGHRRLSSQVSHQANITALADCGAEAILAVTVCGAVDPELALGTLIVFEDLHYLSNRLPDGSLCTLHTEPGAQGRGHWVFDLPFAPALRRVLADGAHAAGQPVREGGCYGHVDGPRFNTRAEIRTLAAAGVTAVSQTAGPETVLAGEAEIPYALLGYATDYANGVSPEPTPVAELLRLIEASTEAFGATLTAALARLELSELAPTGTHLRFD